MSYDRMMERAMKRQEIILRAIDGKITWIQAAQICGITDRQMRRLKRGYQRRGFSVLMDARHKKPSWNKAPVDEVKEVLRLYREQYFDFNVRHFHERLSEVHQIRRSYCWVKRILQGAGLVDKDRRRKKHRRKRERKPLAGMMLHLDGSTHFWLGPDFPQWDLLLILDDANSEVYDGLFCEQEGTRPVMQVLRSTVEKKGVFCSLYTDRASHFFYTPKAGESVDPRVKTQCKRALESLQIELIAAYSPQARGRGERLWRTVQGRLPQELRLAGICTIEQANKYLRETFIPDLNKRFKVEAKEPGEVFFPVTETAHLQRVFSLHHERQVNNDNTVSFKGLKLQIPKSSIRQHFVRCKVTVYEHLDETLSIGFGPHTLARFYSDGSPFPEETGPCGRLPSALLARAKGPAHELPASPHEPATQQIPPSLLARVVKKGDLNAQPNS